MFRNQKITTIVFAFVSCIALIGFFNTTPGGCSRNFSGLSRTSDDFGKIYGNAVTRTAMQHEAQKARLAYMLRLDLFLGLAQANSFTDRSATDFAWNSLVLQHEADLLQIEPTGEAVHSDQTVADEIKKLFQTPDGQFNPAAYNEFVTNDLASLGFGPGDLEEVIAEDVRMKKIRDLLHSTFVVPEADFRADYTLRHQKIDVSVIHFDLADFTAKVNVTDEDIKKAFEQNLNGYTSEEKRGVKFVTFALSDAEKKLAGKESIDARQKLSNLVADFSQALQEKGAKFEDVAAKFKVPVTEIPPFSESAPDPKMPKGAAFFETVFQLTKENPLSEAVPNETNDSYYIIQLGDIVPKRLLTLDEARPQIIEQVKNTRGEEEMTVQASAARSKITSAIAAGKSFADAVKEAGLKSEAYPPLSASEPNMEKPDADQVLGAVVQLKEGEISPFTPTETGGVLVHVDKREPIDQKQYETDRTQLEPAFDRGQTNVVFIEWIRKQRAAANIVSLLTGSKGTPIPGPQQ